MIKMALFLPVKALPALPRIRFDPRPFQELDMPPDT